MISDEYTHKGNQEAGCTAGCTSGPDICNPEFGKRLRELREAKGFSRKELSKRSGIAMSAIQRYENGEYPKAGVLIRLCEEFETSLDWLLFGRSSQDVASNNNINEEIFTEAFKAVEKFCTDRAIHATEVKKANSILVLYKVAVTTGIVDISILDAFFHDEAPKKESQRMTKKQQIIGNGNTQVGGNFTQTIRGASKVSVSVLPPEDTIGGDSMLRKRIQDLFNELRMRRKERFGSSGFSVATRQFKKHFKIPSNQKWDSIWLWKKNRANEVIQYLEEKLKNTIQGRIETAAAKPGYRHSRGHLFARERKALDVLDLKSDDPEVRGWMEDYFGVTSRRDMNDDQLANWVAFLETKVDQL